MSEYSKLDTNPLLIVCVCIFRCLHPALGTWCLLNETFPRIYGGHELGYYFKVNDMECIWDHTRVAFPTFFENMKEVWKKEGPEGGSSGRQAEASEFIVAKGLMKAMSPQEVDRLSGLETSEQTLKETFLAIVTLARTNPDLRRRLSEVYSRVG
ncbi:hypothetical protein MMC11_004035 [Xylographa trunciseda]|nr:hypothetical protein [Xylographa trunciseda]